MVRSPDKNYEDDPGWLLPFTDMVVLLMTFFAISYTVATSPQPKAEQLQQSIAHTLQGKQKQIDPSNSLELALESIRWMLINEGAFSRVQLLKQNDGFILVAPSELLFASSSDQLTSNALGLIKKLATAIRNNPVHVQVEGHTDNHPISTQRFASNWELSAARAIQVVKPLIAGGVPPQHLSAVGFADTRPLAGYSWEQSEKHRRVVLRFMTHPELDTTLVNSTDQP